MDPEGDAAHESHGEDVFPECGYPYAQGRRGEGIGEGCVECSGSSRFLAGHPSEVSNGEIGRGSAEWLNVGGRVCEIILWAPKIILPLCVHAPL